MSLTAEQIRGINTLEGSQGEVFITRNGVRKSAGFLKKMSMKAKIKNKELPILGKRQKDHKSSGLESQEGSATLYDMTSTFRDMMIEYIKNGIMPEFEVQAANEDTSSGVGRQEMLFTGCRLTEVELFELDIDAENLETDISFTWDDVEMVKAFDPLEGIL